MTGRHARRRARAACLAAAAAWLAAPALGASKPSGPAPCRDGFTPERYASEASVPDLIAHEPELLDYFVCRAVVLRQPDLCVPLKALHAQHGNAFSSDPFVSCQERYWEKTMMRAFITGAPDAPELCQAALRHDRSSTQSRVQGLCAVMVKDFRQPRVLCAEAKRSLKMHADDCESLFLGANGDVDGCLRIEKSHRKARCLEYALFSKAYGARSQDQCGDSAVCRYLMTEDPSSCRPFASLARESICGDSAAAAPGR